MDFGSAHNQHCPAGFIKNSDGCAQESVLWISRMSMQSTLSVEERMKVIDGLCAIIQDPVLYEIDHALYLFCGRKCDQIKAILEKEPDGSS